ncbi:MAG: hypothetical protein LQ345_001582 [Seirophora villosa]|nr:MAG: hypothetical protein LQ345_001582 [Seirophora villosa]
MGVNIGLGDAETPDKGYQLYITALVMVIVAGLVVLGRFAARWPKKSYGYDDYAILVSLVFSIALTVTINLAVVNGYGRRKASLEKSELSNALMYFYVAQVVYKVVVGFNKISILMLYLRIFISKFFRLACYINLGIVVAFTIGSTIATVLQCVPIAASWDKTIDATCTNKAVFWYAFAVINILTDAIILFLPVREILRLHLDRRNFIPRGIWTLIEANTGIICASLPMLYKPAAIIFPWLHHNSTSNASRNRKPPSKTQGSSYVLGRRYSIHSGKPPQGTLPESSTTVSPGKGRRFPNHGFGSRTELWEKEDDEYPLGGEPSLPSLELGPKVRGGQIMRQVDVDVTYHDHSGRAVTSDPRVQDAREAV